LASKEIVGGPLGLSPGVPLELLLTLEFSFKRLGPLGRGVVGAEGLESVLFIFVGEIMGRWWDRDPGEAGEEREGSPIR